MLKCSRTKLAQARRNGPTELVITNIKSRELREAPQASWDGPREPVVGEVDLGQLLKLAQEARYGPTEAVGVQGQDSEVGELAEGLGDGSGEVALVEEHEVVEEGEAPDLWRDGAREARPARDGEGCHSALDRASLTGAPNEGPIAAVLVGVPLGEEADRAEVSLDFEEDGLVLGVAVQVVLGDGGEREEEEERENGEKSQIGRAHV